MGGGQQRRWHPDSIQPLFRAEVLSRTTWEGSAFTLSLSLSLFLFFASLGEPFSESPVIKKLRSISSIHIEPSQGIQGEKCSTEKERKKERKRERERERERVGLRSTRCLLHHRRVDVLGVEVAQGTRWVVVRGGAKRERLSARRTPRLLCARVESTRLAPVARYNFRVSQWFGRGTRWRRPRYRRAARWLGERRAMETVLCNNNWMAVSFHLLVSPSAWRSAKRTQERERERERER